MKSNSSQVAASSAEEAALLAAIVESSDDAIISKDLNGIILTWNGGAERLFGYSVEEAVGRPVSMLAAPGRGLEMAMILERIRRGERVDHFETQRRAKDGRILNISLTVSPVRDGSGRIIGASKVARDITEQKQTAELRERLAAIVESSDDAIISKDLNGIIRSWNRGAERIFGYTAAETIGQPVSMLAVPERVEEIPNILARIQRGDRVDHYETNRRTKDGRVLTVSLTVSPVRNAAGEIVGASKIARDITDKRRLEEALQAQTHILEMVARGSSRQEVVNSLCRAAERQVAGSTCSILPPSQTPGPGCWSRSIISDRGDLLGTLAVCHREARDPQSQETDALNHWLHLASIALSRLQREEALRASEARFRTAVSAVSSLVWTNDAQGRMTGEQPAWAAFTGQQAEQYQGTGWLSAVHPDDAPSTLVAWETCVREQRMLIDEHRLRRHDGVYRLFSVRAVPVFDDAGHVREWVGVHTDITEERRLIEQRADALRREQQARQTAELLNKVGPILEAELDTQTLTQKVTDLATELVNAQFGALFHNVRGEAGESYTLYTISGVPRDLFSNLPMPRNTHVFGPTFRGEGVVRCDDITKDPRYGKAAPYYGMPPGHLPVRSYLAVPVMSRSGEVLGGLFFGHESSGVFTAQHEQLAVGIAAQAAIALDNARLFDDLRRSREELARSNEELRHANADLEQFAYSASHDLKEPLRLVAVYSQLLKRRYHGKLDEQADQYLDFAAEGARRMEALVSDLLAYTQAVNITDEAQPVLDANRVLDQALFNLQAALNEAGAKIERQELPNVNVQEVHLLQLFQNLLGNALKYRGDSSPRIRISARRDSGKWRLCVHDNGIGIEPEYHEQIFGVFKRLHTHEQYAGTGIGLAICQKIVQKYGGAIWVESEGAGRGSTFCFTLPGPESDGTP